MKAFLTHEYGSNAGFKREEVDAPKSEAGHVIIEVKATSINPVDHKILTDPDLGVNPPLPAILHMDVAGIVKEVGDGVTDFQVGDEVYGCAGGLQGAKGPIPGALADFMLADARLIALKPTSLSFKEAAALPLVSITAWEGLFHRAKIEQDDHVLIHGGTGGVGHIALQLAKQHGARVAVTVGSDAKAGIAKGLGADDIVPYKQESVDAYVERLTGGAGFDAVFDTAGGANLDASFASVRTNGQVISIIGHNSHDLTPMHIKGLSLHLVFMLLPMITGQERARHGHILHEVAKLVDAQKLKPLIDDHSFTFSEANEAHARFASGKHVGKIVLENA